MNATSTKVTAALDWLDDAVGAITVKEARQAVRSRFVVSVQFLFLAILVVVLGAVLLSGNADNTGRDTGRDVFVALNVMLHIVCVVCVPLYVGVRLAAERDDANVDLMFSTTLRPWSVILGKMTSGLLVGLLAVSACAPFMVLCYFLRGVDIPTIAFVLAVNLLCLGLATLMAVFIGALPVGMVVKIIVALAYLSLACASVGGLGYEMAHGLTRSGGAGRLLTDGDAQVILGLWLLGCLVGAGLLVVLASAMIAPGTSNRALPVRVYVTAVWLVSALAVGIGAFLPYSRHEGDIAIVVWAVCWSILLALAMLVAGSERDVLGPRMVAGLPQSSRIKRALAFFFYSGAGGGLAWAGALAILTLGVAGFGMAAWGVWGKSAGITSHRNEESVRMLYSLAVGLSMAFGYVLLAGCLRRALFAKFTRAVHTGVVAVGLMVLGTLVPVLLAFMLHDGRNFRLEKAYLAHAFNPFSLFVFAVDNNGSDYQTVAVITTLTAAFMVICGCACSVPWFWRQARVFAGGARA